MPGLSIQSTSAIPQQTPRVPIPNKAPPSRPPPHQPQPTPSIPGMGGVPGLGPIGPQGGVPGLGPQVGPLGAGPRPPHPQGAPQGVLPTPNQPPNQLHQNNPQFSGGRGGYRGINLLI